MKQRDARDNHDPGGALEAALDDLQAVGRDLGASLGSSGRRRLRQWAELVIEWRERARLTAARTPGAVVREIMVPAAYALALLPQPVASAVDLGCGNGCTGVTLAELLGHGTWWLVDRSESKITFCRYALQRCGTANVRALGRWEAHQAGVKAGVVLARALPRNAETERAIASVAAPGARVVRWVGGSAGRARKEAVKCGGKDVWVVLDPVDCST